MQKRPAGVQKRPTYLDERPAKGTCTFEKTTTKEPDTFTKETPQK